jgi:eukaryotic-like serine/threonine-protein kinase
VRWLSDSVVDHLCRVADWPDLAGTKYEVIEKVGQGGMASVYKARDRDLDRDVALKVLLGADANASGKWRLEQEARVIARLEHPGIVPIHDTGLLPDGRVYYAMKLVHGKRLDEHAVPGNSVADVLRLFERICEAVAFAHSHGVVHRDLKPQNIMVGAFGEVLVMDWGVAKLFQAVGPRAPNPDSPGDPGHPATASGTVNGTIVGTPGYMAPEQSQGLMDLVNERTDIYGLGAILYFLLTGHPPNPAVPHDRSPGPVPGAKMPAAPGIPRALQAIYQKAMAPTPEDRYRTAQELSADVGRFLARQRVMAYRERWFEAAARMLSKHRVAVLLVLAYLLMRFVLLFFRPA